MEVGKDGGWRWAGMGDGGGKGYGGRRADDHGKEGRSPDKLEMAPEVTWDVGPGQEEAGVWNL